MARTIHAGHFSVTRLSHVPCYLYGMSGLVLVIEDEVDLATTLEYNLRSEGFEVRVAHSGRQGLAAATTDPLPDVIVLDLMLPDLAGTEICRRLASKSARATSR